MKGFHFKNFAIASYEFSEIKIDPRAPNPRKRFLNAPKVGLLLDSCWSIVSGFILLLKAPLFNYELLWAMSLVTPTLHFSPLIAPETLESIANYPPFKSYFSERIIETNWRNVKAFKADLLNTRKKKTHHQQQKKHFKEFGLCLSE